MLRVLQVIRRKGLRRSLRYSPHWLCEKYHERRLGVDTAGYISLSDLGFGDREKTCGAYEPIGYHSIFRALKTLDIRPERDVFIDYGSGKGRAVIAAATFPFKRAVGIELSEELTRVARSNVERARRRLRCSCVEFITADAVTYTPPDDITVVLLYNPFSLELLQTVLEKICASLAVHPRDLHVIFKYPYWAVDPLSGDRRFTRLVEHRGSYTEEREKLRVYRYHAPTGAAAAPVD